MQSDKLGLPEPQRSEPAEPVEILPEIDVINHQTENVPKLHVTQKTQPKTHSRPHVEAGSTIKRALITFVSRTGEVRRWAFDCIFSPHIRKPTIIEFKAKRTKDARFYFSPTTTDRDVRNLVGSWFGQLGAHDPDARVNLMGEPMPFFVDIED